MHLASQMVTEQWYVGAYSHEVGSTPLRRVVAGHPLVLYRASAGNVVALTDRCVHRHFPLSEGHVVDDRIVCGYHGFTYDRSGACVAVPAQTRIPAGVRVHSYDVVEQDSFVWVWAGQGPAADPATIPRVPRLADPAWCAVQGSRTIAARYGLLIDNLLDLSHETYLHGGHIGTPEVAETPITCDVDLARNVVYVTRKIRQEECPPFYSRATGLHGPVSRWQEIEFHAPALYVLHVSIAPPGVLDRAAPGDESVFRVDIVHAVTPCTPTSVMDFWSVTRHFAVDDEGLSAFLQQSGQEVVEQDVIALTRLEALFDEDGEDAPERSIGIDTGGLAARRMLASLAAGAVDRA